LFQDPAWGVKVACVSSDDGWPPESAYRPISIWLAVEVVSTYKLSEDRVPLTEAMVWKASA
jgi:hypothetical protein